MMIILLISVSIFNVSIISFVYFIFCMVLIHKAKETYSDRKNLVHLLKYYLLPFMLLDIALILAFQWPA